MQIHMQRFPFLDPQARRTLSFSFARDLTPGDSIVAAIIDPSLAGGVDETPAAVLVGEPAVVGAAVLQLAEGRPHGNAYRLKCRATTAAGEVLTLTAVLTMREGA